MDFIELVQKSHIKSNNYTYKQQQKQTPSGEGVWFPEFHIILYKIPSVIMRSANKWNNYDYIIRKSIQ